MGKSILSQLIKKTKRENIANVQHERLVYGNLDRDKQMAKCIPVIIIRILEHESVDSVHNLPANQGNKKRKSNKNKYVVNMKVLLLSCHEP